MFTSSLYNIKIPNSLPQAPIKKSAHEKMKARPLTYLQDRIANSRHKIKSEPLSKIIKILYRNIKKKIIHDMRKMQNSISKSKIKFYWNGHLIH